MNSNPYGFMEEDEAEAHQNMGGGVIPTSMFD
jgi:hypothetical protein